MVIDLGFQLSAQWKDMLASAPDQTEVMNVAPWLSRATMDSVGEGEHYSQSAFCLEPLKF
jgi:hypothetical protein